MLTPPASPAELDELLRAIDGCPEAVYVQHDRLSRQFRMHQHCKGQLLYVEEGVAALVTPTRRHLLPARHYVWVPPGHLHYLEMRSPRNLLHYLSFPGEDEGGHPFFRELAIYPVTALLYQMMQHIKLWAGNVGPEQAAQFLFIGAIKAVLPEISPHPLPVALPTTADERLQPVLGYIQAHLADPLALPAVAQRCGFSVRNLSRLFQQHLSLSFKQYVVLCRMAAAMELLLQAPTPIGEVARRVGYASLSAFSNAFCQVVNRRPTEFLAQTSPLPHL